MNGKYLGILVSLLGILSLIIFNSMVKIYGTVAGYDFGIVSSIKIISDNFLISFVIILLIIIIGLFLTVKEYFKEISSKK